MPIERMAGMKLLRLETRMLRAKSWGAQGMKCDGMVSRARPDWGPP